MFEKCRRYARVFSSIFLFIFITYLFKTAGETNKHRYVIATQSQPLRQTLRQIPAVPIVHVNRAVMVLEPPSEKTLEVKGKVR